MTPNPINLYALGPWMTPVHTCTRFGAMDDTKSYKFTCFGGCHQILQNLQGLGPGMSPNLINLYALGPWMAPDPIHLYALVPWMTPNLINLYALVDVTKHYEIYKVWVQVCHQTL
jgi:hypothetical protein